MVSQKLGSDDSSGGMMWKLLRICMDFFLIRIIPIASMYGFFTAYIYHKNQPNVYR